MERSRDQGQGPELPTELAGLLGGADTFGRALDRWASEAAVDEAARARVRDRWLRIQAEEESSLAGTLVDLAERGSPLLVHAGVHRLRGIVVGIGADFVALRSDAGQRVLVPLPGIDLVRAEPGSTAVRGDRRAILDVDLASVLGPVASDRPEVLVRTDQATTIRGELRAVGTDVLHMRADGDPPAPVWVPLRALRMLVLDPG